MVNSKMYSIFFTHTYIYIALTNAFSDLDSLGVLFFPFFLRLVALPGVSVADIRVDASTFSTPSAFSSSCDFFCEVDAVFFLKKEVTRYAMRSFSFKVQ